MNNGGLCDSIRALYLALNAVFFDRPHWQHEALQHFRSADDVGRNLGAFLKFKRCKSTTIHTFTKRLARQTDHSDFPALFWGSAEYPTLLSEIPDPPLVLYYRGDINRLLGLQIAVVGPRKPSAYGQAVTTHFCDALREHFCIVSGMAFGVDKLAHESGILGSKGSIAVLGSGIDCPYPKTHSRLYSTLSESHLVLSEYPPGTPPMPHHFPQRNRIVAGLCVGTLLPEAQLKSGSMITARLAMEYNRELWCVPGSVLSPYAAGCHALIQDGAALVQEPDDIVLHLGMPKMPPSKQLILVREKPKCPSIAPEAIWQTLSYEDKHINAIIEESRLPVSEVTALLMQLQLMNLVIEVRGEYYRLKE